MSEETLAPVRGYMAAYGRGDFEEGNKFLHPDVTWRAIEGAPDDVGLMQGQQALLDYYRQWTDTLEDLKAEPLEDLIEAGDKVVSITRNRGRMKGSDAEVEMTLAIVFEVRDGKIVAGREYATKAEALEAAGL
jgi:ketosteroid isomerase-like protein